MVGLTRFMNANLANKRVEIGFTFLGRTWQRSQANTEAKLLPLTHTFETLGLNRVELMTDFSKRCFAPGHPAAWGQGRGRPTEPCGNANGRIRDTVVFIILKNECPGVKQNLEYKLGSRRCSAVPSTILEREK